MTTYRLDRCNRHQDRNEVPRLCHVCQRIQVERDIVTRTVDAMLAAGYSLNVNNGGDDYEIPAFTTDRTTVLEALFQTDNEHLCGRKVTDGEVTGRPWVFFVYGNDGYDVISDYHMALDDVLAPVNAYAETLS